MPRPKPGTSMRKGDVKAREKAAEKRVPNSPLHAWLRACGMGVGTFARKLGVNVVEIKRWEDNGKGLIPMIPVAMEIERLTNGEVPVESWVGTRFGKRVLETLRAIQATGAEPVEGNDEPAEEAGEV